jgi:hypothetical protein
MRKVGLLAFLAAGQSLFGWGVEGHRLVARLALEHLTPVAAARVKEILGPNDTLVSVSSWADQVRNSRKETAPWHFINIPISQSRLDMKRDCPNQQCVIAKIEEFRVKVGNRAIPVAERKEMLMFLVHFIGDMHQPLHCSNNKDKGGNDVRLEFFGRPSNLHSVWDSGVLGRMGAEDALFGDLSKDLAGKRYRQLAKGNVRKWAVESHREAQLAVYGGLPKGHTGALKLDGVYEQPAERVVREEIERAGARLARVLNSSLK